MQTTAERALANQHGSVVALDVATGAVLAMYSQPHVQPERPLGPRHPGRAEHVQPDQCGRQGGAAARVPRATVLPGSTFKVLTSKAAIETGIATRRPGVPRGGRLRDPRTSTTLLNFGNEAAAGPSGEPRHLVRERFATLGYELGNQFAPVMEECGINSEAPPIDLAPHAVESVGPLSARTGPVRARYRPGDVFTSPLQMALIAAGIANGGVIKEPHVVKEIQNSDGKVGRTIDAWTGRPCMSPTTAQTLTNMMVDVVNEGTGTAA